MLRFFIMAFVVFSVILGYLNLSMIAPLKVRTVWKFLLSLVLLAAACKDIIFRLIGGGMPFMPQIPRWLMIMGSAMYGFLIITFFLLFIKDIIWIIWKICGVLGITQNKFPADLASKVVIFIALILTFYGTYEAVRIPDVERHDVYIKNLSPEFEGLKVAMIVDLHASALNDRDFVQGVVNKTNALSPDLILMPGDFVDGRVSQRRNDLEPLKELRAKLGVFGTSGNHEYYSGYDEWFPVFEEFGIDMLENEHVVLTSGDGKLIIAGIPDKQGAMPGFGFTEPFPAPDLKKALANIPDDAKNVQTQKLGGTASKAMPQIILMDHRPEAARENAKYNIALQVSGHTHGGQMPILDKIIEKFNKGYVRGWYDVKSDKNIMKLYVSRGTSQWGGFPMRILDNSEITLFILHGEK